MVQIIVILIIIAVVAFDLSILRKQDEALFRKKFHFPSGPIIFYLSTVSVLLILTRHGPNFVWFFFLFIFPFYLIRRRNFRKAFFESGERGSEYVIAMPSHLTLVSDAIGLLWMWFFGMFGIICIIEILKKISPLLFSELGEIMTMAASSSVLLIFLIYRTTKRYPGLSFSEAVALKRKDQSWHKIITIPALLGLGVALLSSFVIVSREVQPRTPLGDVLESTNASGLIMVFLMMAVLLAPIFEEIIFRGYFFYVLSKYKGQIFAIYVIAIIFALLHVEQYWGDWLAITMVGILGLILSFLRAWTKTSLATMVTHFFYNGTMTILPVVMLILANPTYYQYQTQYSNLDFQGKEKLLKESIVKNPKFSDSYNDLAWLYAETNTNLEEALALIDQALEFYPKRFAYLDTKSEVLYKMGRLEEAIVIAEDLVNRYPKEQYAKEQLLKFQEAFLKQHNGRSSMN